MDSLKVLFWLTMVSATIEIVYFWNLIQEHGYSDLERAAHHGYSDLERAAHHDLNVKLKPLGKRLAELRILITWNWESLVSYILQIFFEIVLAVM